MSILRFFLFISIVPLFCMRPTLCFASLTPVQYTSFQGKNLTLYAYKGRNISLLVDKSTYDITVLLKLIDKLDLAYDYYHLITDKYPEIFKVYDGLLSIAVVDSTCGAGCGYLGWTGVEIQSSYFEQTYNEIRNNNRYTHLLFYELGRNFWFYGKQLGDKMDAFVTGFAVANRYRAMEYANALGAPEINKSFEQLKNQIFTEVPHLYFKNDSLSWLNTLALNVPPENPYGLDCVCLAAGLLNRIWTDFGNSIYANFYKALYKLPIANTQQEAANNFIQAYQEATGTTHGCPLLKTNFQVLSSIFGSTHSIPSGANKGAFYGFGEYANTINSHNENFDRSLTESPEFH